MVGRAEEPSGVAIDHLISCEEEYGQDLIAVRIVGCLARVAAAYLVFVVLIETVSLSGGGVFW